MYLVVWLRWFDLNLIWNHQTNTVIHDLMLMFGDIFTADAAEMFMFIRVYRSESDYKQTGKKQTKAFFCSNSFFRPDLIDMEVVSQQSNRENLEQAFEIAESLGVTRLLDAEGETVDPLLSNLTSLFTAEHRQVFSVLLTELLIFNERCKLEIQIRLSFCLPAFILKACQPPSQPVMTHKHTLSYLQLYL